jgi:hypothetical protein
VAEDLPNISRVEPAKDYTLRIKFRRGGWKTVQLAGFIALHRVFEPLRDQRSFRKVKVAGWGSGVGWPGDLDLSASTLWHMAQEQAPFAAADFVAWQERVGLSNQEAADALGVSLPTIKNLRSGKTRVSNAIAIACRAMAAESTTLAAHYFRRRAGRRKAA